MSATARKAFRPATAEQSRRALQATLVEARQMAALARSQAQAIRAESQRVIEKARRLVRASRERRQPDQIWSS